MIYPDISIFPLNKPTDFNKRNKKAFSESFVKENLRRAGWTVYAPIRDTGLDLVASKVVKLDNTTNWNSYEVSSSGTIKIFRFIQIKTRAATENQNFGFTPKSTDLRNDPRYAFFLYSDQTNDFIILPIYDFLNIIAKNYPNYFKTPTFKQGNGKINNFRLKEGNWFFSPGNVDLSNYVNVAGLKNLQDVSIDKNIKLNTKAVADIRYKLIHGVEAGATFKKEDEKTLNLINSIVQINKKNWIDNCIKSRKNEIKKINSLNKELKNSVKKYWFVSKDLSNYIKSEDEELF